MTLALRNAPLSTLAQELTGAPLSVVFADGDAISALREGTIQSISLEPPFHVSDEDAYWVLPSDIGVEILDILRDGDEELLEEAIRDSIVVSGTVESTKKGEMTLFAEECISMREALRTEHGYAETYAMAPGRDPVADLNAMDTFACTVGSQLIDEDAFEAMVRGEHFVGTSWKPAPGAPPDRQGDPTFAWARRAKRGGVAVELLLFQEYEELVAFVRPIVIRLGD